MDVIRDAILLSSGTITTLTGENQCSRIDKIQQQFVMFVQKTEGLYKTWMEAWNDFKEESL
jgi:hypothetical protein